MDSEKPSIVVVGSSNMDLVVKSPRIPATGETILGSDFAMVPGGKGANQAVAAARLGGRVYFVARLGKDIFGEKSLANFIAAGIDTTYVMQTPGVSSGVALITVEKNGDNSIVVAPGANKLLSIEDVDAAKEAIAGAGAVAAQLEIPLETVQHATRVAHEHNVPFILDPAPACELPDDLLAQVYCLTPNETEARILTGVEVTDAKSAAEASERLLDRGVKAVILTMGSAGYYIADCRHGAFAAAAKVRAVDSTAAGDAFAGALALGIARGQALADAAEWANYVAALSVTRMGAQPSMPTAAELRKFIENYREQ